MPKNKPVTKTPKRVNMPKNKPVSDTPKRVNMDNTVRRKRKKYVRSKGSGFDFDIAAFRPEEFEPMPSTSSAPEPIVYHSFVTPENLKRYQGAPPGTCAMLRYSRTKRGGWNFHPKLIRSVLNAYKDSPDYKDLKNKRFNTSFLHETRRGERDIQIFTPEEDNDPKWKLPEVHVNITDGEPGKKYENAFMTGAWADLPSILDDPMYIRYEKKIEKLKKAEVREIVNKRRRRSKYGRKIYKRSMGPMSDKALDWHWGMLGPDFFNTSESEEEEEVAEEKPKKQRKSKNLKKERKSTKKQQVLKCNKTSIKDDLVSDGSLQKDFRDVDVPGTSLTQSQEYNKVKIRRKKGKAAFEKTIEDGSTENPSAETNKEGVKILKRKSIEKTPTRKSLRAVKKKIYTDMDSDDSCPSDDSLSSFTFKTTDASELSYYQDCLKRSEEKTMIVNKQEKRGRPCKNPKKCERDIDGKPLPDELLCNDLKSDISASHDFVEVKKQDVIVKEQKKRGKPVKASKELKILDDIPDHSVSFNVSLSDVSPQDPLKAKQPKVMIEKKNQKKSVKSKKQDMLKYDKSVSKKAGSSFMNFILNADSSDTEGSQASSQTPSQMKKLTEDEEYEITSKLPVGLVKSSDSDLPSVKNTVKMKKKASSQKGSKSKEFCTSKKVKPSLIGKKSRGSKKAVEGDKVIFDKEIDPEPSSNTLTSQSLIKSENKLATNEGNCQNNSIDAEDQNTDDSINCSILLKLLNLPPPKKAGSPTKDAAAIKKAFCACEVKLLPFEELIENRVLRVHLNK